LDAIALEFSTLDLNTVASSVVATLAPRAIAQQRTIAFIGADEPVKVKGNPHALEDAVRNLIENAIVHTPSATEVTVTVDRNRRIKVADHGSGVPLKERENIFKRFWRSTGPREGAGLGLSIVKEIMTAHRGSVIVENNPGGGAVFVLSFAPYKPERLKEGQQDAHDSHA
jgi:signal transduction histidine kinase